MTELLKNAWLGWLNYTERGKLAALFLAVLLVWWFRGKWKEHKGLRLYATVAAVCCIVPVTAMFLMLYQTKFYDYQWIWSLVPVTAVTAYGGTLLLTDYWADFKAAQWKKGIPMALFLLAALMLSGSLGSLVWDQEKENKERSQAYIVLDEVSSYYPAGGICLWAPREIMEYAREADGGIRLPYGRNMWDISLNGYAYDVYDEKITGLYLWMEQIGETREKAEIPSLENCVQYALEAGVNCILLPGDTEEQTVWNMERLLGVEAMRLEDYWVFYGRAD